MTSEKDDWAHFRFWAFDLANRNQKWGKTLPTWPTDSVALEPFQTASAYSLLLQTRDAPAQLVRFDLFNKGAMTMVNVDNSAASIAVAGGDIFVAAASQTQIFDVLLNPVGTVPVGTLGLLAVGVSGEVYGVDAQGDLFRLAAN